MCVFLELFFNYSITNFPNYQIHCEKEHCLHCKESRILKAAWARLLFSRINLRPLELVRKINVKRFPLRIEVNRPNPSLSMAVARSFGSTKRKMDFCTNRWSIYIGDAAIQIAHGAESAVHV